MALIAHASRGGASPSPSLLAMTRPNVLSVLAVLSVALCVTVAVRHAPGPSALAAPAALVVEHARPGDLVVVYPHRWHFELDAFGDVPAIAVAEMPVDVRRFNRVFVVYHADIDEPEALVGPGGSPAPREASGAEASEATAVDETTAGNETADDEADARPGPNAPSRILVETTEPTPGDGALAVDPTRFTGRSSLALLPSIAGPAGAGDGSGDPPGEAATDGSGEGTDEGSGEGTDEGSGDATPNGSGDAARPPVVERPLRDAIVTNEPPPEPVDEALETLLREVQRGRTQIFATEVGAFTVELWQSRDAAIHVADLADLLPTARVRLEPRGSEPIDCPWTGNGFVCPDHPWVRVEQVADNFAGQPLRCVWSHPAPNADLVIEFPRVHGASHIEGWYAHTDYAAEVYTGSRTVLDLEVDRGSRRFTAPRDRGRRSLQWRLPRRHDGPLTLRVHAERPDVAHFCWDLRLVQRVGVR